MTDSKRTSRINVRLTEELEKNLHKEADIAGVPPATLASMAISDFVAQRRERRQLNAKIQVEAAKASVNGMLKMLKNDPQAAKMIFGIDEMTPEREAELDRRIAESQPSLLDT